MEIIHELKDMRETSAAWLAAGESVGLVPTMGALHIGHAALIRRAREENDRVVVSVFVNPTQFMPGEDFERYPRTLKADAALAGEMGTDAVFAPSAEAMYPPHFQTAVVVDGLSRPLCGMSRGQGHFTGVATVVLKLFNLVRPTRAYFGQKDAQQAMVLQRMVLDLNVPVALAVCPTVREDDGLALSSRNKYLKEKDRAKALSLREALLLGRGMIRDGERDAAAIAARMAESILEGRADEIDLDYLEIVNPETLEAVETIDDMVLMAGAIKLGETRLIDNLITGPEGPWED